VVAGDVAFFIPVCQQYPHKFCVSSEKQQLIVDAYSYQDG